MPQFADARSDFIWHYSVNELYLIANLNPTRQLHLEVGVSRFTPFWILFPSGISPRNSATTPSRIVRLCTASPFRRLSSKQKFQVRKSQYILGKFFKQSDATDGFPNEELRRWMVADLRSSCLPTGFAGSRGSTNSSDLATSLGVILKSATRRRTRSSYFSTDFPIVCRIKNKN